MNWEEIAKQFLYINEQPLLFHQGLFLLLFSVFLIGYSFVIKQKRTRESAGRLEIIQIVYYMHCFISELVNNSYLPTYNFIVN